MAKTGLPSSLPCIIHHTIHLPMRITPKRADLNITHRPKQSEARYSQTLSPSSQILCKEQHIPQDTTRGLKVNRSPLIKLYISLLPSEA